MKLFTRRVFNNVELLARNYKLVKRKLLLSVNFLENYGYMGLHG